MATGESYELTVDEAGARLDRYLADHLPELSRSRIQKLIAEKHLQVNGRAVKAAVRLRRGDIITLSPPPPEPNVLKPEPLPLDIIYEDEDLLVLNKPAGLTVHPAPGHRAHTMVNALLAYLPEMPDTGDVARPGIVHRLDKDTSGVMVVALNPAAQLDLTSQFKSRSVVKDYLVLVKGRLSPQTGVIEAPIGRDPRHRQRMAVVTEGKPARTDYRVQRYLGDYSLLEVSPETGRTHQIRVHLAAIGHPVVGDAVYGVKSPLFSRQFVHASRLGFKLPSTGQEVAFSADLPPEMASALASLETTSL